MIRPLEVAEAKRTVTPELIAALDAAPAVATRAALALGRTKQGAAVAPLRAHVRASEPALRAMSVYALGLVGDPAARDDVTAALDDANSAVRYAALDALGRLDAPAPTGSLGAADADRLLECGTHDVDPMVRAHALVQLDAFRKAPFARSIAIRLERRERLDRDDGVRWHAAWMLYRGFATYADLAFLARAARDPSELVRVETMRALGHRRERGATQYVRPALGDPSWRVQFEAREALRRLALLPPTAHLRTMPAGIHLPPVAQEASAIARPSPFAAAGTTPAPSRPVAPDPATVALGAPPLPRSAADMNGPVAGAHPRVVLHTSKGDVLIRLYPEWAPLTVANFLELTRAGYFDGNRWFRIVPDFVVQTGDPTDTGDGDAGYTIPAEENPVEQRSGIIAMGLNYDAAGAQRDSAGTQFYVTLSPQPHLDRAFSVFGEVVDGFGVLARLDERDRIVRAERTDDD